MTYKSILCILVLSLSISCKKEDGPDFQIEPYIEFRDITFVDPFDYRFPDTLKVTFYFRDGDFDLGLSPSEVNEPYNKKFYFLKSDGSHVADTKLQSGVIDVGDLLNYGYKRTHLPDTLPSWTSPFNCTNWEIILDPISSIVTDTIYFQTNKNFCNLLLNIFIVNPNGSISIIDFNKYFGYPNCAIGLSARFPSPKNPDQLIITPFRVKMISSKEGLVTYLIPSFNWKTFFAGQRIKLKVQIHDRALHPSNEIETSEVQF